MVNVMHSFHRHKVLPPSAARIRTRPHALALAHGYVKPPLLPTPRVLQSPRDWTTHLVRKWSSADPTDTTVSLCRKDNTAFHILLHIHAAFQPRRTATRKDHSGYTGRARSNYSVVVDRVVLGRAHSLVGSQKAASVGEFCQIDQQITAKLITSATLQGY